ncbi:MAG: Orotate phosphoribosyltransferase [Paracidovorax wautersii]|uniref:Orotate phosphoribosyltransferase n=1 Tax=Paracidovorax wautersii TaxID=1177982 RepID=A0A7V8JQY3_9BURK|nr:MAG: Orotate phosphoribosyltransferase [Paracidovorax wautersii]
MQPNTHPDARQDTRATTPATTLRWASRALTRLWPARCRICQSWPCQTLCDPCVATFGQAPARCPRCAERLPAAAPVSLCTDCRQQPPPQAWTLAWGDYGYPWSFLLGRLKFGDDVGLARALGRLLAQTPGLAARLDAVDLIVALPLSPQRLARRGYNQSQLLAAALAAHLPPAHRRKLRPGLLDKPRHTPAQHELPRAQRLANVRHAYRVRDAQAVDGRRVLLVDDVMTTGATLQSAARTLLAAGAREVGALVLARA